MKYERQLRKSLRCPSGDGGRLADLADGVDQSRFILYGPHQTQNAQFFLKCPRCKLQIGISVI